MKSSKAPVVEEFPAIEMPKIDPMTETVWETKDVAEYLGIGRNHVYKLIREQGLWCDRLGKRYTFYKTFVVYWRAKRQTAR